MAESGECMEMGSFDRVCLVKSLKVIRILNEKGYRSKGWTSQKSRRHTGNEFTLKSIYRILVNPIYIGMVRHKDGVKVSAKVLSTERSGTKSSTCCEKTAIANPVQNAMPPSRRSKDYWFQVEIEKAQQKIRDQIHVGGDIISLKQEFSEQTRQMTELQSELQSLGEIYSVSDLAETCDSIEAV